MAKVTDLNFKTMMRVTVYILGTTLFLAYFNWRMDIIPNKLGLIGYIDDAIVAILLYIIVKAIVKHGGLEEKRK